MPVKWRYKPGWLATQPWEARRYYSIWFGELKVWRDEENRWESATDAETLMFRLAGAIEPCR